ncbi:hypothetical protein OHB12_02705 [Nocardia sp. NBC_01730]|uniref:hypothetical protein n=1 Tax=Nocardia sp. NBC_01730 TaxID=2975998 RepID=UPI002E13C95F|nr:hypothetical protein OHB12_02705 [Nocardia sp. NBC_01730]
MLGTFEYFRSNPDSPKLTVQYVDTLISLGYDDDRLEFIEIVDSTLSSMSWMCRPRPRSRTTPEQSYVPCEPLDQ